MLCVPDIYAHMSAKHKKFFDGSAHWCNLYLSLVSMFEWSGLPDTIRPELLESLLISQGTACIGRIGDGLYTGTGDYMGDVVNFLPQKYQFTNVGIGHFEGALGVDCEVCWNNSLHAPDAELLRYSAILTEIDVSERVNVLFTRFLRVPAVEDSTEQQQIVDAVKQIMDGKFTSVVKKRKNQNPLADPQTDSDRYLDLTDVDKIDRLQYLNQYRDHIIKRWYQMYGQGMQSTAKLAQQTTDELHGNDAVSMIIPTDRLRHRQDFCDRVNAMFDTSISVKFSDAYADSYAEMQELYSTGKTEPTASDTDAQPDGGDDDA